MKARETVRATALAAAIAAGAGALTSPPAVAALTDARARPVAKPSDFDGDGLRDVVVSAANATVNGRAGAGYVAVLYGSRTGGPLARKQIIHQDSAGVPDRAEDGDRFGGGPVTGDFDRDGYTDLAVSAPGEDIGEGADAVRDAGSVVVVWGGRKGLSGATTVHEGGAPDLLVGTSLAAGDFDGDGKQDLVAVERRDGLRQISGPFRRDGSHGGTTLEGNPHEFHRFSFLDLAAGDLNRDGRTDLVRTTESYGQLSGYGTLFRMGTPTGLGPWQSFGAARFSGDNADIGDVNRDGYADIVIGRTQDGDDEDVYIPTAKGGMITWIPGSAKGPLPARARAFNQDSPGVPGIAEGYGGGWSRDEFGTGVSVGDVNGDGYGDIAAGVPGESFDNIEEAGSVVLLPGTKDGPTGRGSRVFSQDTAGVPGAAEHRDRFAGTTTVTDLDGDGKGELIAGAPLENRAAGAVWVFRGSAAGATAKGSLAFGAGSLGTWGARGGLGGSFNDR
ncbi:hypothetical protein [Streptomyces yaizuensis]|uniref:FG-GAP-like repeat-containing protein n=1 Tax=Streptomyces yaizuensis TaxID=2989713 RepID=A0ABQ5NT18_9ACTN|nr:hypothetical protein [Streptomyces sp. YSPA8]GLF93397.1 FG-GAP-like repeat-containing protein [Streptomyces sp. YSPA8]